MAKQKPYLAQTHNCNPSEHKSKHFFGLNEAIEWVNAHGGGSVKKRKTKVLPGSGYGLGRVEFDQPLRVWGEVYESPKPPHNQR